VTTDGHVLGHHAVAMFGGCEGDFLHDANRMLNLLVCASEDAGYSVVGHASHLFEPQGVTCVVFLAQSHLVGHSWPEHDIFVVDLFVCGPRHSIDNIIARIQRDTRASWVTSSVDVQHVGHQREVHESESGIPE
jgi:S-adenosylmethionine decarboxylase